MKAITLWQPWASLIMWGGKCIENRSWKPPDSIIGQTIAIHAGKRFDGKVRDWLDDPVFANLSMEQKAVRGAFLGTARLVDVFEPDNSANAHFMLTEAEMNWWETDQYGWRLDEIRPLPSPIPWAGSQGLWYVLPVVVEKMEELYQSRSGDLSHSSNSLNPVNPVANPVNPVQKNQGSNNG